MDLKQHLETLALKNPDERRQALQSLLDAEGFSYIVQEEAPGQKLPRGTVNYIVNPEIQTPHLLFCAHHDAVLGSFGANDNAASICILLALAKKLEERNIPAEFAFFDGEETGNSGSRLYVRNMNRQLVTAVINLDLCGFGDSIAVAAKGNPNGEVLRNFCSKKRLEKHHGHLLKHLPKSDDISFAGTHIPTLSIALVPRSDIQFLRALATYGGNGILGKPPEYDMILGQMEVVSTMHGGYRDDPEWIEEESMQQVYRYLLDAVTSPPEPKKRFGFF